MNKNKLIGGVLTLLLVIIALVIAKTAKEKPVEVAEVKQEKPAPVFEVQDARKKDYGFKLSIDECYSKGKKDLIVVDVDDAKTYVIADAKRYYSGPYPINESDLLKIEAATLDKDKAVKKVSCLDLQRKYTK